MQSQDDPSMSSPPIQVPIFRRYLPLPLLHLEAQRKHRRLFKLWSEEEPTDNEPATLEKARPEPNWKALAAAMRFSPRPQRPVRDNTIVLP